MLGRLLFSPAPALSLSPSARHALASPVTILELELAQLESTIPTIHNLEAMRHSLEFVKNFLGNDGKVEDVFDAYQVAVEVKALLTSKYPNTHINICSALTPIHIKGYRHQFQELLMCLTCNACEAYPNHDGTVNITYSQHAHNWKLSVTDHGTGMNWWQRKICWLPHVTFKKQGTGVGLWFVKWQIKQLGGSIHMWSYPKLGTHFQLTLPVE